MKVIIGAECFSIKGGVAARCSELRVTGHGISQAEAVTSLQSAARAFLTGLLLHDKRYGETRLPDLLRREGIPFEGDGEIEVEVECV